MQSHYTKLLRATLTASLMLVAMAGTAVAGPLEDAVAASERHDYRTALRLFRLLAEQGNAIAQSALGYMYEMGKGVPQNYVEAAKWLRLAAEQGRVAAQDSLGGLYVSGRGVSKDYVVAYMWLSLSAAQGDHDSAIQRDLVAKLMTPAQIAEAQKLAREWKPKP